MNRIARYNLLFAAVIFMATASGCGILNPNPKNVWHDGEVVNTGDRTLYCAFENPDPEHQLGTNSDYTIQQLLNANGGTASYLLHERSTGNPYILDIFNIDHVRIRTLRIAPDAQMNDHGSWDWTANAYTGAVQFYLATKWGHQILQSLPDQFGTVTLN